MKIHLCLVTAAASTAAIGSAVLLGHHTAAASTPSEGPYVTPAPTLTSGSTSATPPPGWPYEIAAEDLEGPVRFQSDAERAIPPSYTDLSTIEVGGSAEHY